MGTLGLVGTGTGARVGTTMGGPVGTLGLVGTGTGARVGTMMGGPNGCGTLGAGVGPTPPHE